MAIALVQSTANGGANLVQASGTGTSGTLTPTYPSAATSANTQFLFVYLVTYNGTSVSVATPSGWNAGASHSIPASTFGTSTWGPAVLAVFWRTGFTGTSQAVSLTISPSGSWFAVGGMMEFSGASTTAPIDSGSGFMSDLAYSTTGSKSGANLTPSQSNTCAVAVFAANDDYIALYGARSGWTEIGVNPNTSGLYASMEQQSYNSNPPTSGTALQTSVTVNDVDTTPTVLSGYELFVAPPAAGGVIVPNYDGGMSDLLAGGLA